MIRGRRGVWLAALLVVALAGLMALVVALDRASEGDASGAAAWTFQGEQTAIVREAIPVHGPGTNLEIRSVARIWFQPGAGWRMEIDSDGSNGQRRRIFGSDGVTLWGYDPITNRYTLHPESLELNDPRASLAVMRGTAGTSDIDGAIAAIRAISGSTVTEEGRDVVAGRDARVLLAQPYRCVSGGSGTASPSGETRTTTPEECTGFIRYWLDEQSGWVLKAEADDGAGSGFSWDTRLAAFDATIDPALFRFTPPPEAVQVDSLD
ncbi:MAG: LolA family protein [Dehalococcoidia bacterium]